MAAANEQLDLGVQAKNEFQKLLDRLNIPSNVCKGKFNKAVTFSINGHTYELEMLKKRMNFQKYHMISFRRLTDKETIKPFFAFYTVSVKKDIQTFISNIEPILKEILLKSRFQKGDYYWLTILYQKIGGYLNNKEMTQTFIQELKAHLSLTNEDVLNVGMANATFVRQAETIQIKSAFGFIRVSRF